MLNKFRTNASCRLSEPWRHGSRCQNMTENKKPSLMRTERNPAKKTSRSASFRRAQTKCASFWNVQTDVLLVSAKQKNCLRVDVTHMHPQITPVRCLNARVAHCGATKNYARQQLKCGLTIPSAAAFAERSCIGDPYASVRTTFSADHVIKASTPFSSHIR